MGDFCTMGWQQAREKKRQQLIYRGLCPREWTTSQLINKTRALVDRWFGVFRGEMVFSPAAIWTLWRRRWIVWRRGTFSWVSNLAAKQVQLEDTFAHVVDRWPRPLHHRLRSDVGGKGPTRTRASEWTRCRNWTFVLCPAKLEAARGLSRPEGQ